MIHYVYRISDIGYKKEKPDYINNINCLRNFLYNVVILSEEYTFTIIADNISKKTHENIKVLLDNKIKYKYKDVSIGHGAGTFLYALNYILSCINKDNDIVYFIENDYVHLSNRYGFTIEKILEHALLEFKFSFVTLYDHPDKYLNPEFGGNPYIEDNGELTRLFKTKSSHWKLTNSTTMTFATTIGTLKRTKEIILKYINGTHPNDFGMFIDLRQNGYSLASPIPSLSTHGETRWLAPFIDWEYEITKFYHE